MTRRTRRFSKSGRIFGTPAKRYTKTCRRCRKRRCPRKVRNSAVFSIPDETVHRTKVADWLELEAIASPDGRIGFGTLVAASAMAEDQQPEDMADEDIQEDGLVLTVQSEIARRRKNM